MGAYHRLLEIELQHGFYVGQCCPGLRFVPTAASLALIERIGALTRATPSGLLLLADGEQIERHLVDDDDTEAVLSWFLQAEDPNFRNATAGLGRPRHELMVFDARHAVPDEAADLNRLHPASVAGENELVRRSALDAGEALELMRLPQPPYALVRVPLQALRRAQTEGNAARYLIRFAPRATVWSYWFVGAWTEPALQVADLAGDVDFEPMPPARLADGRSALVFRSTRPIALQQRPSECFQLHCRSEESFAGASTRASRVLVKRLPVAAPRHFSREVIGEADALVSEIFVHR